MCVIFFFLHRNTLLFSIFVGITSLQFVQVLEYIPVTNLKPDTEDAEKEESIMENFFSKKKYRQVNISY